MSAPDEVRTWRDSALLTEYVLTAYGRYSLAAFGAFYDESDQTNADLSVLAVAVIMFEADNLRRFNDTWFRILGENNLEYFHMVDRSHHREQFDGWSEPDCDAITRKLIDTIVLYGNSVCVCGVERSTFCDTVYDLKDAKALLGSDYATCLLWCVEQISKVKKDISQPQSEYIGCLYEDGAKHRGTAQVLLNTIFKYDIFYRKLEKDLSFRLPGTRKKEGASGITGGGHYRL